MSTTKHNKRNRKIAAVALVAVGVAGLGAASASQITVGPTTDAVASGVTTTVEGLTGVTASVRTVRVGTTAPNAAGEVPVSLAITTNAPDGTAGTLYTGSLVLPFTVASGAATVTDESLTSHTALNAVSIVMTAP